MNEIDERKNVDKICPFFPPLPTKRPISMQPGPYGHLIEVTMTLTTCQKDRCQLWSGGFKACIFELIPAAITNLFEVKTFIKTGLDNIESAIRDLKEVTRGES